MNKNFQFYSLYTYKKILNTKINGFRIKGDLYYMKTFVKLYSDVNGEISSFLNKFYLATEEILKQVSSDTLELEIDYENPVEMSDLIGTFIENKDEFKINMWICIDEDVLINVTGNNADEIIRYLYERFPY